MCGRFSVKNNMNRVVSDLFNIPFEAVSNSDLCPSQTVSTIVQQEKLQQLNASWGIKPSWSKKLIINSQSETASIKPIFRQAMQHQRCLVPCNGWYEWRTEVGEKVKYFFEHSDQRPLYMAGILFQHEKTKLVTLTTKPNEKCAEYHKRMPVLIEESNIDYWFNAKSEHLESLFEAVNEQVINVKKYKPYTGGGRQVKSVELYAYSTADKSYVINGQN